MTSLGATWEIGGMPVSIYNNGLRVYLVKEIAPKLPTITDSGTIVGYRVLHVPDLGRQDYTIYEWICVDKSSVFEKGDRVKAESEFYFPCKKPDWYHVWTIKWD